MKSVWRLAAALALPACLSLMAFAESDEEKARQQLRQLQTEIKRIDREISRSGVRRDKLQRQLRDIEVQLGKLQGDINSNYSQMSASRDELNALEFQREKLEHSRDEQQIRIATELRTAWQVGQQGQVKVLLSQESPHTVARTMGYYRYLLTARNERLTEYRHTLEKLQSLSEQISGRLEQLEYLQLTLEKQQAELISNQAQRKEAVSALNASISDKGEQLSRLNKDRQKLEELLKAIEETIHNLQVPENFQAFKNARGKMPWPLAGKPSNRFGTGRNQGKMRWQGLSIPAREGTTVRAIHHGRVVYADWLRGSGLLLILDHGDGYMSLYAHNQTLMRDVGEWVTAGTPISTVGNSGGQDTAALYFEIRHDGKPVNPAKWCRG